VKLDNAESFNLDDTFDGIFKPEAELFLSGRLDSAKSFIRKGSYERGLNIAKRECGEAGIEPYLSVFRKFLELDLPKLEDAISVLGKAYPTFICQYFADFIGLRIDASCEYLRV
jgi:hypothetical protein